MTDQSNDTQFSIAEERESWNWSKRPGIKTKHRKKDFESNSADAVRQAIGQRACQL
jgi:hypothetical protein